MSTLVSRTSISVLAAVAGTLFVSYCIYFDRKRRSDPEFKKKLRDSKLFPISFDWLSMNNSEFIFLNFFDSIERKHRKNVSKEGSSSLPDLKDHEAVQQFFLREVSL